MCHESQSDAKIFTELSDDESALLNTVENLHLNVTYGALGVYVESVNSYLRRNLSWESDIVDPFRGLSNVLNCCAKQALKKLETSSSCALPCNHFGAALAWCPVSGIRLHINRRVLSSEHAILPF